MPQPQLVCFHPTGFVTKIFLGTSVMLLKTGARDACTGLVECSNKMHYGMHDTFLLGEKKHFLLNMSSHSLSGIHNLPT